MTDRLPQPVAEDGLGRAVERASATPAWVPRKLDGTRVDAAGTRRGGSLSESEAWLVSAITGAEDDAAADAAAWLRPGPRMDARERLEIYRFGYRARLVECLVDDYPALAASFGEEAFEALCHAYIERYPSSSPSLNFFGRHMAAFCRETEAPAFFSELARLEWALVEAVHSSLPEPFDFRSLTEIPTHAWADARLVRNGAVQLLHFTHPVNAFYQTWRASEAVPDVPKPAPTTTAVYRRGLRLWRMDLTPAMTGVLEALFDDRTIGEALDTIGAAELEPEAFAEAERSVMVWFRSWVDAGFFAGVVLAER